MPHWPEASREWKRPHGRPRCRWIDQICKDNDNTPPAALWQSAVRCGHHGATLWPSQATQRWPQRLQQQVDECPVHFKPLLSTYCCGLLSMYPRKLPTTTTLYIRYITQYNTWTICDDAWAWPSNGRIILIPVMLGTVRLRNQSCRTCIKWSTYSTTQHTLRSIVNKGLSIQYGIVLANSALLCMHVCIISLLVGGTPGEC